MTTRIPLVLVNGIISQLPNGDAITGAPASGSAYSRSFNATTDWGSLSAGYYTITTAAENHGAGTTPLVQVFSDNGDGTYSPLPNDFFSVDKLIYVNITTGDVLLKVRESGRFAGVLSISSGGIGGIMAESLTNAADDATATLAGVQVNEIYRNGSVLMIRVS